MKKEEADRLLMEASYRFAKTMPNAPHSYTRRAEWDDAEEFNAVAQYIEDNAVEGVFWNRKYTYYYLGKYKYWTGTNPLDIEIINRAEI